MTEHKSLLEVTEIINYDINILSVDGVEYKSITDAFMNINDNSDVSLRMSRNTCNNVEQSIIIRNGVVSFESFCYEIGVEEIVICISCTGALKEIYENMCWIPIDICDGTSYFNNYLESI